jgi:antibiotic biosynthesis monooxygenase (ABM) superfamily enzyme
VGEVLGILAAVLSAVAVIISAYFGFRGKKVETDVAAGTAQDAAVAARFDDASKLAEYIRSEVARQVELGLQPMREELARVKTESHEMHDAVRAHFTQLWIWDRQGRPGPLPMLPQRILHRLGLGHLLGEPIEDTEPIPPKESS